MRTIAVLTAAFLLTSSHAQAQLAGCWAHWQTTGAPFTDLEHSQQLLDTAALPSVGAMRYGWHLLNRCAAR
ncbi:MAG TPA: hypothetical protein VGD27_12240, partial [Longimicrobiales bacterium]